MSKRRDAKKNKRFLSPLRFFLFVLISASACSLSAEPDSILGKWICTRTITADIGREQIVETMTININRTFVLEIISKNKKAAKTEMKNSVYRGKWLITDSYLFLKEITVNPKDPLLLSERWQIVNWPDENNPLLKLQVPLPGSSTPAVHNFSRVK